MRFDNASKSSLSIFCHGIGFVQNNHLEGRIGILLFLLVLFVDIIYRRIHGSFVARLAAAPTKEIFLASSARPTRVASPGPHRQARKLLDLFPDHADSALVTGIQLQNTTAPLGWMPKLFAQRQCHTRLSTPGRPVQQQVGQPSGLDRIFQCGHHLRLVRNVVEGLGAVSLYPRCSICSRHDYSSWSLVLPSSSKYSKRVC
mmetsp:Transcript_21846/g.54123  ORF Transcript_21846/g.54123 Transcript_21846/m.54123 type:complete len:201 (-) Transcript_21846:3-605(-)